TDSEAFVNNFTEGLQTALGAEELQMRGIQHVQGQLEIARMAGFSESSTFFDSFEARNVRMKMNLIDGLFGKWKTGNIAVARLEADLRAGTNDDEGAEKLSKVVFAQSSKVEVQAIEIASASLHWGYSEPTRGSILNSEMLVQRVGNGWRLSFKKGRFRQNWLRNLTIKDLVILVEPSGLTVERAELTRGEGSVSFDGLKVKSGARPELDGIVKIRNLNLESILPPTLLNFVDGSLSGDFKVFGSTNSGEGVGFEGQVVLDGRDSISIRDRIHLLKALSVIDYSRNYRRVDFSTGSFDIRTHDGGLSLSNMDIQAEELFAMTGNFTVRLPSQEEVDKAVAETTELESSPLFISEDEIAEARRLTDRNDEDFSLRKAAQAARRIQEGSQSQESLNAFDRLSVSGELRQLRDQAANRMSRMLQYEGNLMVSIPGDAFERAPGLAKIYPVNPGTGRLNIPVELQGHLYELTLEQAEKIYEAGRRVETGG
ncbi:MAG: hypothetical protein ACO3RV_07780, partial [Luteolibacter sp.]